MGEAAAALSPASLRDLAGWLTRTRAGRAEPNLVQYSQGLQEIQGGVDGLIGLDV